ncbi:DUF6185 family protein, partial [Pantoea sp. GbtcB22]|uniref:DUF6185 family protein n=1 Tax=Pantoea sp. GbtcB22 TaxID=2824767 RepID=UPI0034D2FA74
MVLAVVWWGCSPGVPNRDTPDNCFTDKLSTSSVDAEIRMVQHHQPYTRVSSDITMTVPKGWKFAKSLTFSEDSKEYRQAMHC